MENSFRSTDRGETEKKSYEKKERGYLSVSECVCVREKESDRKASHTHTHTFFFLKMETFLSALSLTEYG